MARFTVIKAKDAPKPIKATTNKRLATRMAEYDRMTLSIPQGQVGVFEPEDGETARAISLRLARALRRNEMAGSVWMQDGNVYVQRVEN